MNNVYTGETVRIRPLAGLDEFYRIMAAENLEPNEHWGVWHYPAPEQRTDFDEHGFMTTDKYSMFAIERLDTGECIGYEEFGGLPPGKLGTWIGTFVMAEHRGNRFGVEAKQRADWRCRGCDASARGARHTTAGVSMSTWCCTRSCATSGSRWNTGTTSGGACDAYDLDRKAGAAEALEGRR